MACNISKRDAVQYRDVFGNPNLIGRYRRTRKGEKQHVGGKDIGGEGKNGSSYYEIRLGADGVLYCSCPDYRFRGHAHNAQNPGTNYLCKHVRAFLMHASGMLERGESMDSECILYNDSVVRNAIFVFGPSIIAGESVAKTVATSKVA